MVKQKGEPSEFSTEDRLNNHSLILYNDDFNSFDFVIEALVEICRHDISQAEQCALIAHYKGKCQVKSGGYTQLKPLSDALTDRGLTVSID